MWTNPFRFSGDFETVNFVADCVTPVGFGMLTDDMVTAGMVTVGMVTVGMVTVGMETEGMALVGMAAVGDSIVATGCSGCMRFTRWLRPNTLERPAGELQGSKNLTQPFSAERFHNANCKWCGHSSPLQSSQATA